MIGRKTVLALGNMVVGSVLGLVALFLIGRIFKPEANGELTFALGFLGLFFFVTDLGMGQAHVKRVSEGRHPGDCFATFAVFKVVMTGVFLVLSLGSVFVYAVVLGKPIESTTPAVIAFAVIFYVAKALQEIGQSSFEARVETAKAQLPGFLDTLVRVGLTALFALFVVWVDAGRGDGSIVGWIGANKGAALAIATAGGTIVAAVAALVMLKRIFEKGRFRWALLKDYWTFALPLFLTSAASIIAVNIDAAALGFFMGKTEAGIFGAVRRIPVVLQGIGAAVGILLFPTISALAARGDRAEIQRHMDQALRYLSMLLVPIVAFVVLFAPELIHIGIGDEFVSGADAMRVLGVYVLVATFGYAHGTLLMGMDRPKIAARMGIANALIIIVLDILLIPNDIRALGLDLPGLGVMGAAIATLVAATVWYLGLRIANHRLAGYRERGHFWRHLAAALVMAGALWLMDAYLVDLQRWYHLLLFAGAGFAVYVSMLVVWRELTNEDLDFVREAVHPGEMLAYVRSELFHRRAERERKR